jgi:hypothetical protein
VGDMSHVVFGQKGSVRWWVVMLQQPILLSPKFREKSSHICMQSLQNVTVICGIGYLACQDEFFVNNPLDVKGSDEHAPDFTLRLSRHFSVFPEPSMSFEHPCTVHTFFPEYLSNHYHGLCCTFSEICTKFDAVPLLDPLSYYNCCTHRSTNPGNYGYPFVHCNQN